MKKFYFVVMVCLCLSFVGCVKQGNQNLFDETYRNRVIIGDTLVKAIELFGNFRNEVSQKRGKSKTKTYSWIYTKGTKGGSVNITVNEKGIITDIVTTTAK